MMTVSFAAYNGSDPTPTLRRCEQCGRPRDNSAHPELCPICLVAREEAALRACCPSCQCGGNLCTEHSCGVLGCTITERHTHLQEESSCR